MGDLFGGTENTTRVELPGYVTRAGEAAVDLGMDYASRPYQPFGGTRVAPFTGDEQAAFDMTRQNVGTADPYIQQGIDYTQQGALPFSSETLDQYMSPYTDAVVDEIARLGTQNLTENILPGVNSTFTNAGQFGSSRHGEFTNRAIEDTTQAIAGQQAGALQQGYGQALNQFNVDQNRQIGAGAQLANLGGALSQAGYQDAGALADIGSLQRGLDQAEADVAYSDFTEQRDWDKWNAQFLASLAGGVPAETTTTTPGPSVFSQLGGLGLVGYGLFGGN